MRVIKSRFVAYQFYKDGKRIPGLLTVIAGRLIPELDEYRKPYLAARPLSTLVDLPLRAFDRESKSALRQKKAFYKADKVVRVIMEQEYVQY